MEHKHECPCVDTLGDGYCDRCGVRMVPAILTARSEGHTTGPWRVLNGSLDVYGGSRLVSAEPWITPDDESRANAALISAAPDLLAALEALRIALDSSDGVQSLEAWRQTQWIILDAANLAISKARNAAPAAGEGA